VLSFNKQISRCFFLVSLVVINLGEITKKNFVNIDKTIAHFDDTIKGIKKNN